MTVREYHDWCARQRARSRADVEFAAWMVACCLGGMAVIVFLTWLIGGAL